MVDLKDMPAHQVEALSRGESVIHKGEVVTPDALPSKAKTLVEGAEKDALLAHYEKENQELRDKLADLESKPAETDLSVYDAFLPNSKSEIEALSLKKLKALASIKGVTVEGDDKPAFVAALSPEEGK